jgi:multidrug/hemolysin transport system permease protein
MYKRNIKLFFKDKGLFFTSLITPLILLVLYVSFLANVYRDTFLAIIEEGFKLTVEEGVINALVSGQLLSSLLAVSCVTVSFCSNMLMVQDKATGVRKDLLISPIKKSTLALSYYLATLTSTLIVCYVALAACLIYVAIVGWYFTFADILLLILDVFLLSMFGTALSSVVNFFLSTQGQISAVGSVVSSIYGFVSGAYMPLSNLSEGLRNVIMFLPGTYGTSLIRNHALKSAFNKIPQENQEMLLTALRDVVDCNIYFFDNKVLESTMYIVLIATILVCVGAYVLMNKLSKKKV